jgi:hypothetical protein
LAKAASRLRPALAPLILRDEAKGEATSYEL